MDLLTWIFWIVAALLLLYLLLPFLTVLISRFVKDSVAGMDFPETEKDFACIITAYKNAEITVPTVRALLNQTYSNFHIYLVCDECDFEDYETKDSRLSVFVPKPSLRLKAKSIIHAMEQFVRPHEYTVIFDADNLAHPDFLKHLNKYCHQGFRSVQGQRTAKNLDTTFACADATGEFYKNYIERLVPYLIGSSSVISGSGMAVKTDLYWDYLMSPGIQEGKEKWKKMLQEDKILQNYLLRRKEKIQYAWGAIVYDEKVTSGEQVETQRSRWLYSYFQNLPNSSGILLRGLFGLNWNQFLFGLITLAPPLFILVFFSGIWAVLSFWVQPIISASLILGLVIFMGTILWTLKLSRAPAEIWKTIWSLPLFALRQVKALFKMANPNKNFKHTEHNRGVSIDDVLKQEGKA
ncbi:MAG: glycosyltransferase, partial [Saprospiraceae bacterium]|nr:glycosyltransferase [Saprospiraceae bacterium]